VLAAVENGEARVLTKEKLVVRLAASKKGLPYQTYIEPLLHETPTEREKA
jgi:predicted DNA binding CopG/RHH family protein